MSGFSLAELTGAILLRTHGHTLILYGSQARGEASDASDYDLLAIADISVERHESYVWQGKSIDLFVMPTNAIDPLAVRRAYKGIVLMQRAAFGDDLLQDITRLQEAGPPLLTRTEVDTIVTWIEKMLVRITAPEIEAHYRRVRLLTDLLEYYFTLRGLWYDGPKSAFAWLRAHEPKIYRQFELALAPGAPLDHIELLANIVIKA